MTFFSVIIPVYNAEPWLKECLDSVANQSFLDFEVIITNDGSTDQSLEIIEAFVLANEAISVKVINQENAGLGNARNEAAKQSKGEWLCFIDADDYWSTQKLLQCHRFILERQSLTWFYHEVYEKYPNGRMKERVGHECHSLKSLLVEGNPIVPSGTSIKKSVFIEQNGFDEERNRVEDLGLWMRLYQSNSIPGFLEETLTVYRLGSGLTQNAKDHFKKVMQVVEQAKATGVISESERSGFIKRKNYEFARQAHKMGNFKEALEKYELGKSGVNTRILTFMAKLSIAL
jgi:glycosyltransferase involved in cell wall biosynthesis